MRALVLLALSFSFSNLGRAAELGNEFNDAAERDQQKQIAEQTTQLCHSTDEYIRTLTFLRETKEYILPENTSRQIAEKVSRGCDGSAQRFEKTLLMFKKVGISDPKSLELALEFSSYSTEIQTNFLTIFGKAFLSEFLDNDYASAVNLALELSKNYKGDPVRVREDFIALARFCRESKTLELPTQTCSLYAIKMARLSELYPEGVRAPFLSFYTKMREDHDFSMDIKSALEITYNVLKNGPRAPDNFTTAYAFAMKDKGLALSRSGALEFALKMAARSFKGERPPALLGIVNAQAL